MSGSGATAASMMPPALGAAAVARRRRTCLFALVLILPLGLAWRLLPLHLPAFAFKYGGSALWAMAVYWLTALLLPRVGPVSLGFLAGVISVAVELFKKVRWPPLDHFRDTLGGKLLLGRYFTYGAMVAYLTAIIAAAGLDTRLRRNRTP